MPSCSSCQSLRIVSIYAHSRDCNTVECGGREIEGYLPDDLGIGGGDDLSFEYCLRCGKIQGDWPLPEAKIEREVPSDDDDDDEEHDEDEHGMLTGMIVVNDTDKEVYIFDLSSANNVAELQRGLTRAIPKAEVAVYRNKGYWISPSLYSQE